MKKVLSALLSVAMISSAFVSTAFAATGDKILNVKYTKNDTVTTVTEGTCIEVEVGENVALTLGTNQIDSAMALSLGIVYNGTEKFSDVFDIKTMTNEEGKKSYKISIDDEDDEVSATVKPDLTDAEGVTATGTFVWGFVQTKAVQWDAKDVFGYITLTTKKAGEYNFQIKNTVTLNGEGSITDTPVNFTIKVKSAAVKVTDVTPSVSKIEAKVGDKDTVTATVTPAEADQGVTYTSGNEDIIKIDSETGAWEAVGVGDTTITVKSTADSTKSATITVSISAKPAPQASLTAVKAALSEDVANTGYWIYKLSDFTGDRASYKLTFEDKTAEEKLEYTAGMSLTSEGDVSFALYLTATGSRLGHTFATSAQVDTLFAQGADLVIGTAAN